MTVFRARVAPRSPLIGDIYQRVIIYAGVDVDHLQYAGVVNLTPDEATEFVAILEKIDTP